MDATTFWMRIADVELCGDIKTMADAQLILKAIRKVPASLIHAAMKKLQLLSSKDFYKVLKSMSGMRRKSSIAHSFSIKSLVKHNLPADTDFATYLKGLYKSDENVSHLLSPRETNIVV